MTTRKFKMRDRVRVEKIPKMDSSWPAEIIKIFKRVVGHSFRIRDFIQIELAKIWAKDNGSPARNCSEHSRWIETDCIKLVAKKK